MRVGIVRRAEPVAQVRFLSGDDSDIADEKERNADQVNPWAVVNHEQPEQDEDVPEVERIARVREEAARDEIFGINPLVLPAANDIDVADDGDTQHLARERDEDSSGVQVAVQPHISAKQDEAEDEEQT